MGNDGADQEQAGSGEGTVYPIVPRSEYEHLQAKVQTLTAELARAREQIAGMDLLFSDLRCEAEMQAAYVHDLKTDLERINKESADAHQLLTAQAIVIRDLRADLERLRAALTDARELADEGWMYANDHFRERCGFEERLQELRDNG